MSTPRIVANVHILADAPVFEFGAETYPSVAIFEEAGFARNARIDISFTGTFDERQAAAVSLHVIADRLAAWTPAEAEAAREARKVTEVPA